MVTEQGTPAMSDDTRIADSEQALTEARAELARMRAAQRIKGRQRRLQAAAKLFFPHVADLIAESEARAAQRARAEVLALAFAAIDEEPELTGEPLLSIREAMRTRPVEALRAAVGATKDGIRLRLEALAHADAPTPSTGDGA
jgi:hypothetical protein